MKAVRIAVAIGVAVGIAGGVTFTFYGGATAQSQGGSQAPLPPVTSVTVNVPDGGLPVQALSGTVDIGTMPRVDANISAESGTFIPVAADIGGARLEVTANLSTSDRALLAGRTCVYAPIGHQLVGTTAQAIPGMVGRTGILLVAHGFGSGVDYASCWPGLPDGGGTPNCDQGDAGIGMPIHSQGSASFDVSDAYLMRCISCTHGGSPAQQSLLVGGANTQCSP